MQPTAGDPMLDRLATEPKLAQLAMSDDTVLAGRELPNGVLGRVAS
jgi:hypothetical protein